MGIERARMSAPECTGEVAKGVAALRAGQRAAARRLLAQAVRANPRDATAWLWLSRCVDDEGRRRDCLARFKILSQASAAVSPDHGLDDVGPGLQSAPRVAALPGHSAEPGAPASLESSEWRMGLARRRRWLRSTMRQPPPRTGVLSVEGETSAWGDQQRAARRPVRRRRWLRAIVWALAIVAVASVLVLRVLSVPARTRANLVASRMLAVQEKGLEASGVVRAEEVRIASEYGGLIASILAREGEAVAAGDVLVQLDTTLIDAQIEVARAATSLAEARLAQARAGARRGQVALAEAQLARAEAGRVAAVQAVSDTMALVANPQHIRLQIAVGQAQVEAEERRLARALALKDAAEIGKDEFQKGQDKIEDAGGAGRHKVPVPGIPGAFYEYTVPSLPLEMHLMPNAWWQAWIGVNAVAAQKEGLEASLAHLYAVQAHPQDLEAQVDRALSALAQAEAQAAIAQAGVDGLRAGATGEQIAALEARAAQARAALESLRSRRAMMEIVSLVDGVVVDVAAHAGEVAAPGATLLTLSDLAQVRLTVYLPETQIGRVRLGQRVQVLVDSFPGRVFEGRITHIADRAEFTPRNVATKEERVNLVFAIEIGLPNEDGALKPGMPADAVLGK